MDDGGTAGGDARLGRRDCVGRIADASRAAAKDHGPGSFKRRGIVAFQPDATDLRFGQAPARQDGAVFLFSGLVLGAALQQKDAHPWGRRCSASVAQ